MLISLNNRLSKLKAQTNYNCSNSRFSFNELYEELYTKCSLISMGVRVIMYETSKI